MKNFVVSYIDWFDYNLEMKKVSAENKLDAILSYAKEKGFKDIPEVDSIEDFQKYCFDWDCMMNAIEI